MAKVAKNGNKATNIPSICVNTPINMSVSGVKRAFSTATDGAVDKTQLLLALVVEHGFPHEKFLDRNSPQQADICAIIKQQLAHADICAAVDSAIEAAREKGRYRT